MSSATCLLLYIVAKIWWLVGCSTVLISQLTDAIFLFDLLRFELTIMTFLLILFWRLRGCEIGVKFKVDHFDYFLTLLILSPAKYKDLLAAAKIQTAFMMKKIFHHRQLKIMKELKNQEHITVIRKVTTNTRTHAWKNSSSG